jgi:hypothetical protein
MEPADEERRAIRTILKAAGKLASSDRKIAALSTMSREEFRSLLETELQEFWRGQKKLWVLVQRLERLGHTLPPDMQAQVDAMRTLGLLPPPAPTNN